MSKICLLLRKEDNTWNDYKAAFEKESGEKISVVLEKDINSSDEIVNAEILITTFLPTSLLEKMNSLKAVFVYETNIDALPMKLLKEKGVAVFPSHANSDIVAEHAVALALALVHNIIPLDNDFRNGVWNRAHKWQSIETMTVGILGFGHVGKEIYRIMCGMADNICLVDRGNSYPMGAIQAKTTEELIEMSDLLFLALPSNSETRGLFDGELIAKLEGKYVVNVGHADVFNERKLFEMLELGIIKGYASDVWENKLPNDQDEGVLPSAYPFWQLSNVVLSPYCATHEFTGHEAYVDDTAVAVLDYLKGE